MDGDPNKIREVILKFRKRYPLPYLSWFSNLFQKHACRYFLTDLALKRTPRDFIEREYNKILCRPCFWLSQN